MLPEDQREIERRMNIHRLKNEAREITGAEMTGFESPDAPAEVLEQFWQNVVAYERAPMKSPRRQLKEAGIAMPAAEQLGDPALHARLWQIIEFLATRRFYLADTDHLSDRELYTWLRDEGLLDPMPDIPGMNTHSSPIGSGNEEDTLINFRYFADEDSRAHWMKQFPDYQMPERETAPYSRDHLLPQAVYPVWEGEDDEEWDDDFDEEPEDGDETPNKP